MSSEFESGFMVNTPSWHRLEKAVLKSSPTTWEAAREEADLLWDVTSHPVYGMVDQPIENFEEQFGQPTFHQIKGWQEIRRDDTAATLAIQQDSYAVITNSAFGDVIDEVLGLTPDDDPVVFEALMSLYGGRHIVALIRWQQQLPLAWDPSATYSFIALDSRHDAQGGLRGIPTNVRVVCANTLSQAEAGDGRHSGFTIRHTSNWEERVAEIAQGIAAARGEGKKWVEFMEELARYDVKPRQREVFLKRMLPISDDMSMRAMSNAERARQDIRRILESPTCNEIAGNGYGLLMATTEWSDHVRKAQSTSSAIARQVLTPSEPKIRAAKVLRGMARL